MVPVILTDRSLKNILHLRSFSLSHASNSPVSLGDVPIGCTQGVSEWPVSCDSETCVLCVLVSGLVVCPCSCSCLCCVVCSIFLSHSDFVARRTHGSPLGRFSWLSWTQSASFQPHFTFWSGPFNPDYINTYIYIVLTGKPLLSFGCTLVPWQRWPPSVWI